MMYAGELNAAPRRKAKGKSEEGKSKKAKGKSEGAPSRAESLFNFPPPLNFCLFTFTLCLPSRLFGLARIRYTGLDFQQTGTTGKQSMSELKEPRWAVLSERGREGAGLSYVDAAATVARLRGERISGLCIITDAAAARLPQPKKPAGKSTSRGGAKPRRGRKKSAS
jgi:hypothetical protein